MWLISEPALQAPAPVELTMNLGTEVGVIQARAKFGESFWHVACDGLARSVRRQYILTHYSYRYRFVWQTFSQEIQMLKIPHSFENRDAINTETTKRCLGLSTQLEQYIKGAHQPSEGEYLEHVLRNFIRDLLPARFEVSTGFISGIMFDRRAEENLRALEVQRIKKAKEALEALEALGASEALGALKAEDVTKALEALEALGGDEAQKAKEALEALKELYEKKVLEAKKTQQRGVSNQHDILVWDAQHYAPLVRADNLVVIPPDACVAVIEVTKTLKGEKLTNDMKKLDGLEHFYRESDRQHVPYPFTAVVARESVGLDALATHLEKFYYYDSDFSIFSRYGYHRGDYSGASQERLYSKMRGFVDVICSLEKGVLLGGSDHCQMASNRIMAHYTAYKHQDEPREIKDSLGLLLQRLMHAAMGFVLRDRKMLETDLWREYRTVPERRADFSFWIEDLQDIRPTVNITHHISHHKRHSKHYKMYSGFVGIDHTHDFPFTYFSDQEKWHKVPRKKGATWVLEKFSDHVYGVGKMDSNKIRVGEWVWLFVKRNEKGQVWRWVETFRRGFDKETGSILHFSCDETSDNEPKIYIEQACLRDHLIEFDSKIGSV